MSPKGGDDHSEYFQTAHFQADENSDQVDSSDWRYNSFFRSNAHVNNATARAMSQCGMYHTGFDDVTRCHSCQKVHNNWKKGDRIDDPGLHETDCHFFNLYQSNHHYSDLGAEPFWNEDKGTQWSAQAQSDVPEQRHCTVGFFAGMVGATLSSVGSRAWRCLDQCLLFGRRSDTFLSSPPTNDDVIRRGDSGGNVPGLVHKVIKNE